MSKLFCSCLFSFLFFATGMVGYSAEAIGVITVTKVNDQTKVSFASSMEAVFTIVGDKIRDAEALKDKIVLVNGEVTGVTATIQSIQAVPDETIKQNITSGAGTIKAGSSDNEQRIIFASDGGAEYWLLGDHENEAAKLIGKRIHVKGVIIKNIVFAIEVSNEE